jgi:hypothetical protein
MWRKVVTGSKFTEEQMSFIGFYLIRDDINNRKVRASRPNQDKSELHLFDETDRIEWYRERRKRSPHERRIKGNEERKFDQRSGDQQSASARL